jgi:osmotically inducible lipoprotein OsmB
MSRKTADPDPAQEEIMTRTLKRWLAAMLMLTSLAGCAGMSARDQNTAVGAALGGVAGSVLTNGSGVGTVGGAVVGGVIGNQIKR